MLFSDPVYIYIINSEYNIKIAAIQATNQDFDDFITQIKELLELWVIRKSTSIHRSAAFIVRNHNEIVMGKKRMVINYKKKNLMIIQEWMVINN